MQDTHPSPTFLPSQVSQNYGDSNIHKTLSTSQLAALMRGGEQKLVKVTKYFQAWKQLSKDKNVEASSTGNPKGVVSSDL